MTKEGIKELKRDIFNNYEYSEIEEQKELEGVNFAETLQLEKGKIGYFLRTDDFNERIIRIYAGIVSENLEEFMLMSIKEIERKINEIAYYGLCSEEEMEG